MSPFPFCFTYHFHFLLSRIYAIAIIPAIANTALKPGILEVGVGLDDEFVGGAGVGIEAIASGVGVAVAVGVGAGVGVVALVIAVIFTLVVSVCPSLSSTSIVYSPVKPLMC